MANKLPGEYKLQALSRNYEFKTKYLLSCADPEPMDMRDLLALADEECKEMWDNLKLQYTEVVGHPLLRKEIARIHGVEPDDVLVLVPQEGIYIASHCLAAFIKE